VENKSRNGEKDVKPTSIGITPLSSQVIKQQKEKNEQAARLGIFALLLSIPAPILVLLSYLPVGNAVIDFRLSGAMFGPFFCAFATLFGFISNASRYGKTAIGICLVWWAWWIYAILH
jgi:hypothetical protein